MVASVALWSTTPASNSGLDTGANFPEGMAPSGVNDGARGMQAAIRKLYNDMAGKIVAGGSANAITIATQSSWAALADGITVVFRAANTSTNSTVTLALDALTAKNCYHADGSALAVGDIVSGGIYIAAYSTAANGAAGGWLILNAVSAVWSGVAAAEVTVASASTCDILGAASALVAISGTTTITSLGTGVNRVRFVRFTGILTLTHNGTSLILPGGADITTAAGDTMIVEADASSNVRVLMYQRADGTPVANPPLPQFQCRLTKVSTNVQLDRFGGKYLFINGNNEVVPSAGVTLAIAGASANFIYFIYAYMNAGVMTLEYSTTGHSADATYGHQIKTGDPTRSLVGMAGTNGVPAWVDTAAQRFVISFYNRRNIGGLNNFTTNRTTTSTSYAEVNSEIRCEFLTWADEAVLCGVSGRLNPGGSNTSAVAIGIDGTTAEDAGASALFSVAGGVSTSAAATLMKNGLAEGYHYATILGKVSGGTSTFSGSATAGPYDRCAVSIGIRG